jgi:soluble lytic murein transglycosylase-like protein
LNSLNDEVLTTYAGLLLRDLLDRFGGDLDKAIGAYNGGVRSPNPAYASGVKTVAAYARRVIEHATLLDDQAPIAIKPVETQGLTVNGRDVRPWWTEP